MRARFREIARETVDILDAGGYATRSGRRVSLAEDVARAVAGTRLHPPGEVLAGGEARPEQRIEVVNESTLVAGRRLTAGDADVACLVFASAMNPGGGFLNGAQAQEESLARSSALYPCLVAVPEFHDHHRARQDPRYSDHVVHSPRVPVFRDDSGELLDEPYRVTFLTAAAPNAGAVGRERPEAVASLPATLRARAARVLDVAAAHGHRRLVLGAWGCGVFRNDPTVVAGAFAAALGGRPRFDHVCFAVLDPQPGTPTFAAFARILGGGGG
ncbi:TIGR02452 family protein [Rhizohabitans arisaemae]|uniref:TIGR02452 family protein n=1 Tax=Rhizohabitans arisaemae TaxID=2720610 RepID=UPI0024B10236|nr:TIGR02452 family protein [Rhizohabitans arisaemae]